MRAPAAKEDFETKSFRLDLRECVGFGEGRGQSDIDLILLFSTHDVAPHRAKKSK